MDDGATVELQPLCGTSDQQFDDRIQQPSTMPAAGGTIYDALPLPARSKFIRVLDIKGSANLEDPLISYIQVISLDRVFDNPFTALSYVWGGYSTPKDTIQCGTDRIPITTNCRDALRQLRMNTKGKLTIWVDAICINQGNDREKEDQIPLMGEIYSRAEMVYIWLGNGSLASKRAISCLSLAAQRNYLPLDPDSVDRKASRSDRAKFALKLLPPYIFFKSYYNGWKEFRLRRAYKPEDFEELLGRDWFSRAWTFQEIILARNSVFVCGSDSLPWIEFMRGFGSLYNSSRARTITPVTRLTHYSNAHNVVVLEKEQQTPSTRYLPDTFRAFERVVRLWTGTSRSWAGLRDRPIDSGPWTESFYHFQESYINLHDSLLPHSTLGRIYYSLTSFGSLLFILIPPLAVLIYLDNTRPSKNADTALGTWAFITALLLLAQYILTRWSWWWLPRKGSFGEADEYSDTRITRTLVEGVIQTLRQRQATNPKDRVFALYGVLERSGLSDLPRPDYSKPQGIIYHEFFQDIMRWQKSSMTLLLDAGARLKDNPDMRDAPSWVPDWSSPLPEPTVSANFFLSGKDRKFDATPGVEEYVRFTAKPNELVIRGHWDGSITYVTDVFHAVPNNLMYNDILQYLAAPRGPIASFIDWTCIVAFTSRPLRPRVSMFQTSGATYTALTGKRSLTTTVLEPGDDADLFDAYFALTQQTATYGTSETFCAVEKVLDVFAWSRESYGVENCNSYEARIGTARALGRDTKVLKTFIELVNDLARNERRLFVASENVVGCGSKGAAVGDRLALVAGLPAPLVLRPTDPKVKNWFNADYEVICSAFVAPWMDGSACRAGDMNEIRLV
ncbi:heterokaryon incompatibility protein-domain-containing protein [Annulohypoxylon truncatum]|uniref:heterokaryon incompatibility protein-domain-containing protein n=1 Tax=Annulohypoxylon truncatum TaxID=327061 RepID=UPI0020081A66|nr:heterokaryon incompatibility protein-domain-containing protein [Annulohypoxylon truncatum]KAI1213360.1 heterokaryon incompatibility protein-domain-containing protein [Annulohypoxylon truncatum]